MDASELLFVVGVEAFSTGVVLVVLGGVWSVSDEFREPCDSASISLDVISSMPRNVVDDVAVDGGGGGVTAAAAAATAVVAAVEFGGLIVLSVVVGGGLGGGRKFDCTIC